MLTPVLVGLGLVDHDRALLAAVSAQVALPVAVEVQPARHHRSGNRLFPDAGVHRLPVPRDVAWQADVHGQEHGHAAMMPAARSASHPSDTLGDASRRETRGCDGRDPRATVGSLPQQPAQDRQRRRSACAPTSFPAASSPTTRSRTTPGSCARSSELQGRDPLILTLARGHYCPKEHQQHLELAAFQPKIAVAYTQIVTISTDEHHELQEFRASVGAQWTFLSDPGRTSSRTSTSRSTPTPSTTR